MRKIKEPMKAADWLEAWIHLGRHRARHETAKAVELLQYVECLDHERANIVPIPPRGQIAHARDMDDAPQGHGSLNHKVVERADLHLFASDPVQSKDILGGKDHVRGIRRSVMYMPGQAVAADP